MKLSKKSFSAKLYRYFYSINDCEMPKSLCPYFWKLVIAYLLFIPLEILATPYNLFHIIMNKIQKKDAFHDICSHDMTPISKVFIVALISIILFAIFYAFIPLIHLFHPVSKNMLINAYILDCAFIILGIIGFFAWYKDNDNLAKTYISAKVKRICPRIEWTDNKLSK